MLIAFSLPLPPPPSFSRKDCRSRRLVGRHHRDALPTANRPATNDDASERRERRRRVVVGRVHPRHRHAPRVARLHRRARRAPRAHLQHVRPLLARRHLLHRTFPPPRFPPVSLNSPFLQQQHMLSLPMFAFMPGSVRRGFVGLGRRSRPTRASWMGSSIHPYTMLALNLLTQLVCVSGVNQLSSVSKPLFSTNF